MSYLTINLPCEIGRTVYRIVPNTYRKITSMKIVRFVIDEHGLGFINDKGLYHSCEEFGETIFLTENAAIRAAEFKRKEIGE